MSSLHVVIAPDSFKGSIAARPAAEAIAAGWAAARPGDRITLIPLADGGEGTADVIASAVPGSVWHEVPGVRGPDSRPVDARWLRLPDGTAVVDLATASGLPLMGSPGPLGAHTFGLGQVISAALGTGCRALVIGLGGSASTDGGTGLLAALGARFLDAEGRDLPLGGEALADLARIDLTGLRPAPAGGVTCLTDVRSPLCGPAGAAALFGPQKGAGPDEIAALDHALAVLAAHLGGDPQQPGTGAAGGTGYGLSAGWGARLEPGARAVAALAGLPAALAEADLVITGEGCFDATSLAGKVAGTVLGLAAETRTRAAIVAGVLGAEPPCPAVALAHLAGSASAAMNDPARWLSAAGEHLARATT
ncbi:glycerate kinase [Longispora albida]|uniref:glycerate kinase n=1 Tax=Longispora albida TaxID=203523 RepID=UPI00036302FC|nr:glycerate kinase [Longispora albida]